MRKSSIIVYSILAVIVLLLPANRLLGQKRVKPLKRSILLSGNFGEIRSTHLHSGIDIKTGGVEGLPVICVQDGIVSRVAVSPVGYGLALYLDHPDGTTTVYGHLKRFAPSVAKLVQVAQYNHQSYRIDENMLQHQIYFKQGDIIGYSGNSGSSSGPHLHFEIRNTQTEHTLNPLSFYPIVDNRAPSVQTLILYRINDAGYVETLSSHALKCSETGQYPRKCYEVPAGEIGVGLNISDYMNNSGNRLGIYSLRLSVGRDTIYKLCMDSCSFAQTRLVYDLKDFGEFKKHRTVYRCFGNYQGDMLAVDMKNGGRIQVAEDSVVRVRVRLADINGNRRTLDFDLKGKKTEGQTDGRLFLKYDEAHDSDLENWHLELPEGALFSSVRNNMKVSHDTLSHQSTLILSDDEIPLLKQGKLSVKGDFSDKCVICEKDLRGRIYPLKTVREAGGLSCMISFLSRYLVREDTVAPQLKYLGKNADRSLSFKVKDDLSGISSYSGEVNGEWCLFSYDPRTGILKCSLDEYMFKKGQNNKVRMRVADAVGNVKEVNIEVYK